MALIPNSCHSGDTSETKRMAQLSAALSLGLQCFPSSTLQVVSKKKKIIFPLFKPSSSCSIVFVNGRAEGSLGIAGPIIPSMSHPQFFDTDL